MFLGYVFVLCKNVSILFNFPSLFLKSARDEIRSGAILPQVIVEMETSTRCLIIDIFRGIGFLLLWVL